MHNSKIKEENPIINIQANHFDRTLKHSSVVYMCLYSCNFIGACIRGFGCFNVIIL